MHEHAPFFFDNWYNVGRAVTLSAVGYGKFLDHALRKERITREEVRAAIRDEGVTRWTTSMRWFWKTMAR